MKDINHITLIGAGGGGSGILHGISSVFNMDVYDGDEFEEKNVTRQVFAPHAIGANKALCMAEYYDKGPKDIRGIPEMVTGSEDLETDVIICAVDNNSGRTAALELSNRHDVPLIVIANETWEPMSWLYLPEHEFHPTRNPFVSWKLDQLVEERQPACNGAKIIEEQPQLPQANLVSAGFGVIALQSMMIANKPDNYIAEITATPWPTYKQFWELDEQ